MPKNSNSSHSWVPSQERCGVRFPRQCRICLSLIGVVLVLGSWVGCDIPERPPLRAGSLETKDAMADRGESVGDGVADESGRGVELPSASDGSAWETWDAYYVGSRHVGYNHVVAEPVDSSSSGKMRYRTDNVLLVTQGQARTVQRQQQTSIEDEQGRLVKFTSTLHVGPVVTNYSGEVIRNSNRKDLLRLGITRGTKKSSANIGWDASYQGFTAIEQSLRKRPLIEKGKTRTLKMLLPGTYKVGTATLRCSGPASVPMQDGSMQSLTEINSVVELEDGSRSFSTLWIDDFGSVRRTYSPGINLVAYRTEQAIATKFEIPTDISVLIPIQGKIKDPLKAKRIAFAVLPIAKLQKLADKEENKDLIKINPEPGQWVRKTKNNQFQILVSRRKETKLQKFLGSDLQPAEEDSKPNAFVDFRSGLVRRYAQAALSARTEMSKQEMALELTRTTNSLVEIESGRLGLMKASEAAQNGKASPTGRSILLMAMLRANKIPARLAIGLRYQESEPTRMVYHTWVLAYVDDDWIHLDVEDGDVAGCDRILLSTSALNESNQNQAFVPFLDAVTRIKVAAVNASY